VNFTVSGTATNGSDYSLSGIQFGTQVVFAAGSTTAVATLTANVDGVSDNGETSILTLAVGPTTGAGVYAIGAPNTATITIVSP
jgi:hypothetical protein